MNKGADGFADRLWGFARRRDAYRRIIAIRQIKDNRLKRVRCQFGFKTPLNLGHVLIRATVRPMVFAPVAMIRRPGAGGHRGIIIQSAQQIHQGERRRRAIEGSPAGCTAAHGDDARPLQFFYNLIGKGPGDLFIFRKDRDVFPAAGDAAKQSDGIVCFSCDEQPISSSFLISVSVWIKKVQYNLK